MLRAVSPVVVLVVALLSAMAFGGPPATAAQQATPADGEECPTTTPEENEALVAQFYEAMFAGGDMSGLFTADHVHHEMSGEDVSEAEGAAAESWASDRMEDFPDVSLSIDPIVAGDDMVAAYLQWSGSQQDDDEEAGVPATGNSAEWVAAAFFRIECGKIAESWSVADHLGRLMDLGVITEEELQSAEPMATPAA